MSEHNIIIRSWTPLDKTEVWSVLKEANYSNVYPSFMLAVNHSRSLSIIFICSSLCLIYYQSIYILLSFLCLYSVVVYFLIFLAAIFYIYGPPLSDMKDVHKNYFSADEDNHFWVAECDGVVAGTIAIVKKENLNMFKTPKKIAWLRRMAVRKQFRKRGIARKLVQKTIDFCKSHNYSVIELITTPIHEPARNLYKSMGFVQVNFRTHRYFHGLISIWTYEFEYVLQDKT